MKTLTLNLIVLVIALCCSISKAQVSVVSANLNSFQITSQNFFQVILFNSTAQVTDVMLQATLSNSAGEIICSGKSLPFKIKPGTFNTSQLGIQTSEFFYGSPSQASYLKTSHSLPSGTYKYCVRVTMVALQESDDYCEEIESAVSSFLDLVVPYDKDTIDSPYPLLTWTHSEPFSVLAKGEFFRIIVAKMEQGQNPEGAVISNPPVFFKDFLSSHQVQYSTDAKDLLPGLNYAWQVQKISNGVIVDKTEAWEFILKHTEPVKESKYAVLKTKPDAGFYSATNKKIFFRFDEEYSGTTGLTSSIYDEQKKIIKPTVQNEDMREKKTAYENLKSRGINLFELDLQSYNLKKGFYYLEVINEKKEKFILKFYVD